MSSSHPKKEEKKEVKKVDQEEKKKEKKHEDDWGFSESNDWANPTSSSSSSSSFSTHADNGFSFGSGGFGEEEKGEDDLEALLKMRDLRITKEKEEKVKAKETQKEKAKEKEKKVVESRPYIPVESVAPGYFYPYYLEFAPEPGKKPSKGAQKPLKIEDLNLPPEVTEDAVLSSFSSLLLPH